MRIIIASILILIIIGNYTMAIAEPAHYTYGKKTVVATIQLNKVLGNYFSLPYGTVMISSNNNSYNNVVRLGHDFGKLRLNAGKPSGKSFFVESDGVLPIELFVKITIKLKEQLSSSRVLGYSVDSQGNISPVDTIVDNENNILTFYTFLPIFLTWVYI